MIFADKTEKGLNMRKANLAAEESNEIKERNQQEQTAIANAKQADSDVSEVRRFLFSVMNDESADMADRIKAADSLARNAERAKANGERVVKERIERSLEFELI